MSSQELVPAGSHTLVINEPDTQRAIMLMDSHDLEQAMAELRGEVLATFVYRPKGAKPQLTYAGVKEAARLYRNVHFGATAVPLPDGTWMITSYAHNLADNTRVDYPMPYPAFDPANQEQAIKFRANLSKSLRNALAAVLPVAYLQTMIERWLEQGNSVQSKQAAPERASSPGAGATGPPAAEARSASGNGQAPVTATARVVPSSAPVATAAAQQSAGPVVHTAAGGLSPAQAQRQGDNQKGSRPQDQQQQQHAADGTELGSCARAFMAEVEAADESGTLNGAGGIASRVRSAVARKEISMAERAAIFGAINRKNAQLRAPAHAG